MNITKLIIAAALATSAGAALAESVYPAEQPFVSTKTRAEVVAELNQAGGNVARANYINTTKFEQSASTKTRAEVVAELNQAGGDQGRANYRNTFDNHTTQVAGKTRAEVIAELNEGGGDQARENYRNTFNPVPVNVTR